MPGKIVNQMQYHFPAVTVAIIATMKDLEAAEEVIPISSPFNSPIWSVRKIDRSYRMAVGHHKLNWVVVMIAAAVPDVIPLLKHHWSGKFLFLLPCQ